MKWVDDGMSEGIERKMKKKRMKANLFSHVFVVVSKK